MEPPEIKQQSKKIVGQRIKNFRGKKKAKDLAKMAGIDKVQWSRYETGKEMPRKETALKIAQALGVSVDSILKEESHLGQYKNDREKFQVEDVKIDWEKLSPSDEKIIASVKEILESRDKGTIRALVANIEQFLRLVRSKGSCPLLFFFDL